jgi:hypothetical protein
MLTWPESLIGPLSRVQSTNLTNYRDKNQNSHKLHGQKPKLAQIKVTKFKIQKCEKIILKLVFVFQIYAQQLF